MPWTNLWRFLVVRSCAEGVDNDKVERWRVGKRDRGMQSKVGKEGKKRVVGGEFLVRISFFARRGSRPSRPPDPVRFTYGLRKNKGTYFLYENIGRFWYCSVKSPAVSKHVCLCEYLKVFIDNNKNNRCACRAATKTSDYQWLSFVSYASVCCNLATEIGPSP
jgi:hypothetical protein